MFRLRQRHQHVSGVYPSSHIILYYMNRDTGKITKKYSIQNFLQMRTAAIQQKYHVHINDKHTCG